MSDHDTADRTLLERTAAYFAWQDDPQFEPCPRCDGKGYHHGFGEDGHDPDHCESCGGPGEQPTEPGLWSADDLLSEAAAALARRIAEGERLRKAITAFAEQCNPSPFDSEEALSEVPTSAVDELEAALVAEEPPR